MNKQINKRHLKEVTNRNQVFGISPNISAIIRTEFEWSQNKYDQSKYISGLLEHLKENECSSGLNYTCSLFFFRVYSHTTNLSLCLAWVLCVCWLSAVVLVNWTLLSFPSGGTKVYLYHICALQWQRALSQFYILLFWVASNLELTGKKKGNQKYSNNTQRNCKNGIFKDT